MGTKSKSVEDVEDVVQQPQNFDVGTDDEHNENISKQVGSQPINEGRTSATPSFARILCPKPVTSVEENSWSTKLTLGVNVTNVTAGELNTGVNVTNLIAGKLPMDAELSGNKKVNAWDTPFIKPSTQQKKTVKLTELHNNEVVEGAAVAIPFYAVEEVRNKFANTLYGYFIGKHPAFLPVERYVKNTWSKFGLERVMLRNGFFLFQFSTREGMK